MTDQEQKLKPEQLTNRCDAGIFEFETTESLAGAVSVIGQDRAVNAIDFGIHVPGSGFNIFALGLSGTGRTTTIRTTLVPAAAAQPVPGDWVYVNHFADPNRPRAITLPAGHAARFRREMEELIDDLMREIPRIFESEEYEEQREEILQEAERRRNEALGQLEREVNSQGFALLTSSTGLALAPVIHGQVITPETRHQIDEATARSLEARQAELRDKILDTMRSVRNLEKATKHALQEMDRQVAAFAVDQIAADLKAAWAEIPEVVAYLDEVEADVVEHVARFRAPEESEQESAPHLRDPDADGFLNRYRVNVLVDCSEQEGGPVVFEVNPTYGNLLGRIEHRAEMGALVTDFTMIKAGALHRANGGYLILEAEPLLDSHLAWEALKRALKNRQIRTEEVGSQMQLVSTTTLEPEPIPLDVKVVLIGDPWTYYGLYEYDGDFRKLFKVQADFGDTFERTPETMHCYAEFIAARCHEEGLLPFDREAVARIVEFGSRLAEHQQKLSTRFGDIADLVREAAFWARRAERERTTAADVSKAIDQRTYRANRAEEEIQERIDEGSLRIHLSGEAIGQVNGLTILSLGNYDFGRPSRITARTYTGKEGVVSLDREAKLSGRIYDKGLLTLNGYLGGKYALDLPLNLSATISLEQSYDEVEGDSASSTELYALLSSLAGVPIQQGIAVTGSVDQQGNVQPVGGVNEKVEGFFDTCRSHGLTGDQGVMIPAANRVNLMLRDDLVQAVAEGRFQIYAVDNVDEGLEILTGIPAGTLGADGSYPEDTLHDRVMARLDDIAENLKHEEEEGEGEDDPPSQEA
ncbi:MAG: AAA family ATPase [Anaerolineae bacterium]|nr:AAA family ATPase [Anaerolineae bacterium]